MEGDQSPKRKPRYLSESAYHDRDSVKLLVTSTWDWIILSFNAIGIVLILIMMGLIQAFLSMSEEYWTRSPSKMLRIRKGKEKFYKLIPTRLVSRLWGFIHHRRLVFFARPLIFKLYSCIYGVKIEEAKNQNLFDYQNLAEFFRRELREDCRPLAQERVVSPCDGKVLICGEIGDGLIEQVKGASFTVDQFLGPPTHTPTQTFTYKGDDQDNRVRYCQQLMTNPATNELYYCVIYLAPGDYHRFHSPVDWTVETRRHFPGQLYSVNPSITSWFDNLFVLNERVCLMGKWMHGFFSYTAVGATMVGSIKLPWDEELRTNQFSFHAQNGNKFIDKKTTKTFKKGDEIGEFNLGSTIVLTFEAPNGYQFPIGENEIVRLGQALVKAPRKRHSMPNLLALETNTNTALNHSNLNNSFHFARHGRKSGSLHNVRRRNRDK